MKKNILLLFFVLLSSTMFAQNKATKIADKLFERFEYVDASQKYLELAKNDNSNIYICKQLGDCYYFMNNTVEAEKWYAKALNSVQLENVYYYRYAQVLKSNKKYNEADKQMKLFSSIVPNDNRSIAFNRDPNYLSRLNAIDNSFDLKKLEINSPLSDFGGVLFKNTFYFVSSRNTTNPLYGWNNEPFLDIYQSNVSEDGTFSDPILVKELNTKYHEGPVSITKDGSTIYLSSESFNDNLYDKKKIGNLKYGQVNLFKASSLNGKWTSIKPLSINSKGYSSSNPSIDSEGKFLYFSSNMPGSIGGMDIWKVQINSDGTLGTPENMGNKVNTEDDESFPFISDNNVLYFSSKGLSGFGGFDIFSLDLNSDGIPENIGKPVNTEKDDFAYSFNNEKNTGFLSSNREGFDNIYSAKPIYNGKFIVTVKNEKDGNNLVNSKVIIQDDSKTFMDTKIIDESGVIAYKTQPDKSYLLEVYKDGFVTKSVLVPSIKKGTVNIDVSLVPIDMVLKEDGEIILNPIYFDFNKSDITVQAAQEIDKVVYLLQQNEKINISVKSHTDSRGSELYNLSLSKRRADSTVEYVISKGIDSKRVKGKGLGESEPKINCNECSEEEHSLNRRSEFFINK